jgi:type I restriction enzyme, S subunit
VKLAAYPHYKSSGVAWFREVPEHWAVKRLKTSAMYWVSNVDKVPSDDEEPVRLCNYTDVYYSDYIKPDMGLMETTATPEEIRRFGLQVGDAVITKDSEEWSDIAVPALVVESAPDLVCGYHLAIVRPVVSALFGPYLLRVFQACSVNQQFQVAAKGVTRYGLPKASIGEAWLPLPSLSEQRAIADFLDRETAKLDTLVEKKRALIEKLKEKRAALISRTVTRGLPPDAARAAGLDPHLKLKPSGVDWLGDIPEQWLVSPLKSLAKAGRRQSFTDGDWIELPFISDEGVRLIQTGNVGIGVYKEQGFRYITDEAFGELNCTAVAPNDVLICRLDGPVGRACLAPNLGVRMITSVDNTILKVRQNVSPQYVVYLLSSSQWLSWIDALCRVGGGFRMRVSRTMLGNLRVGLPQFPEQRVIAAYLDRETIKIDRMVEKVEEAIARLQEYRTALITAAVTGNIDVRGVGERSESATANTESARMEV